MKKNLFKLVTLLILVSSNAFAVTVDGYIQSGRFKMSHNDIDGALDDFKKAVESEPNNIAASSGLAWASALESIGKNDLPQAKVYIDKYISFAGQDGAAEGLLSNYYYLSGNYSSSIEHLNRIIASGQKNNPLVYYVLGNALLKINRLSESIDNFSHVLELQPNNAKAFQSRGMARVMVKELELANADFNKAIEIDPNVDIAHEGKGLILAKNGKHEKAVEEFNMAIKNGANNPALREASYFSRGDSWKKLNNLDAAINDYTRAIELNAAESRYFSSRASLSQKKKEYDKAIQDYRSALKLNPNDAISCVQLGCLLRQQNQKAGAMDLFYKAGNIFAEHNKKDELINVIELMALNDPSSPLIQRLYSLAYPGLTEKNSTNNS